MQFVDNGGLADPGISGDQQQFRGPVFDDAIKGDQQLFDLASPPEQFLGNQQSVRRVLLTKRKIID